MMVCVDSNSRTPTDTFSFLVGLVHERQFSKLEWTGALQSSFVAAAVVVASTALVSTQPAGASRRQCVVIASADGATKWQSHPADCATRLSPASTFKIPHALVALEVGIVTTETIEKWDGTKYPEQPLWNRDHTVISAMRPSVLWFFQRIAPRIGAERMQSWLERFAYGSADVSGDIRRYWVNGTLRISPLEQVSFLTRFYTQTLPVSRDHQAQVARALIQQPGCVENARGVHRLVATWPRDAVLNSKTGATTTTAGQQVSWLVGALTVGDRRHVFASAVWGNDGIDQLDGARLAFETLAHRGALER